MDKELIDKLLEVVGDSDRAALEALSKAYDKKFAAYRADDSRSNLAEWQAAEKALKNKVEQLQAVHLDSVDFQPLENLLAVVEFLKAQGFKIRKSKLYKDAKSGLIKVNADQTVNESEARAYAQRFLKKVKSTDNDGALDALYQEKAQAELSKIKAQEEKIRFELERDQGKYMARDLVLTQFAVKWSAIEGAIKHLLQTRATDWIYAVAGDAKKRDLFVDLVTAELDMVFNGLANIEELNITFKIENENQN